ncbi:hypothetical protein [Nocardia sp. CA-135398]|uniref:hypothetical protein n=1 Tax=Nocardia sp. CA-135398 TaxID=3239977 RepID=UPI003D983827
MLVAAGTQRYVRDDLVALDRVPASLERVVSAMSGLGITPVAGTPTGYLLDAERTDLFAVLGTAVRDASVVIVYYTGHGVPFNNKYYLPTSTTRNDMAATAIGARELLEDHLLRLDPDGEVAAEQPKVLVIFDCCFSGTAVIEDMHSQLQGIGNPNTWVMASANTTEYAEDGVFAMALTDYLRSPKIGRSQRYLSLEILVGEVNSAISSAGAEQEARWFPPASRGVTGLLPFLPNPEFQPAVAGFTIDEQRHWISKLGIEEAAAQPTGFYLTGRTGRLRAVEDLAEFLAGVRPGVAIVTGSPGAGKSTLLALPVLLSSREGRAELLRPGPGNLLIRRAAELVSEDLGIIGVHARGMNADQIAAQLGEVVGAPGTTAKSVSARLAATKPAGGALRRIVVDAVDEAATPEAVIDFLQELSEQARIRVVFGIRKHLLDRWKTVNRVIDLDAQPYRDRAALTEYARLLLVAACEPELTTPYQVAADTVVDAVAEAIGGQASTADTDSFVIARSLALAVRARADVIADATAVRSAMNIPQTVYAAFEEDLERFGERAGVARILLQALAWANGPGLPWENIWAPVARAIAGDSCTIDDDDVRWLLANAGAYIREDVGPGGRSVFRPFHDLLAEHLRRPPTDTAGSEAADHPRRMHELIVQALFAVARRTGSWSEVHPYLRTYLAEHASAAGRDWVEVLLAEPDYLAVADPAILSGVLAAMPQDETVRSYRRAAVLLTDRPADNLAHLTEAAVAVTTSAHLFDESTIAPSFTTIRVWVGRDDSALVFRAHRSNLAALGFGADRLGRDLLFTIDGDGDSELWDIHSGRRIDDPDVDVAALHTGVDSGVGAQRRSLRATRRGRRAVDPGPAHASIDRADRRADR